MVASDLLSDEGSILVQIVDENVHSVRTVLDEVSDATILFRGSGGRRQRPGRRPAMLAGGSPMPLWHAQDRRDQRVGVYMPSNLLRELEHGHHR
jgi:hypothetical protein